MEINDRLSAVLTEFEDTLIEFESHGIPPKYTDEAFRAATKIFMSAIMDRMWVLQERERIDMKDRCNMAIRAGKDLREFVKTYTDIDTFDLYR